MKSLKPWKTWGQDWQRHKGSIGKTTGETFSLTFTFQNNKRTHKKNLGATCSQSLILKSWTIQVWLYSVFVTQHMCFGIFLLHHLLFLTAATIRFVVSSEQLESPPRPWSKMISMEKMATLIHFDLKSSLRDNPERPSQPLGSFSKKL